MLFKTKRHVPGTEGTHNYAIIAASPLGFVAVRLLTSDCFRVRVEPANLEGTNPLLQSLRRIDSWKLFHSLSRSAGWKQPGDSNQNRFSIVVSASELHDAVTTAVEALSYGDDCKIEGDWAGALAAAAMVGSTDRNELIERLRQAKVGGVNSANNWTTTTLVAKLIALTYSNDGSGEHHALTAKVKASGIPGANLASQWSTETLRKKALLG
ncbi:MAG: hypothetical protein WC028_25625 [Candidatus Obscuribacterales bacterium]